ncbi:uncharacterized protein EMH_0006280 [Eimeria mitis]|uniref:Uncharacterized protein n=1 Tax=Eimeria mitis TaxID=44415 RepID=U6JYB0_9EIME|nr:uncharacterized protein EMH_0006280 [Eimeria mitis]CDJ30389.1 hypothetical protein EMH_0006280 [Eimeria mitis]
MPLLLLIAIIVAAAAAGASFVRHIASEQPAQLLEGVWSVLLHCGFLAAAGSGRLCRLCQSAEIHVAGSHRNKALEGMVLRSMQQQQDSQEGQMQQTSVALLPIPMTDELEQVVATLSSSRTRSRDLWDSISKLQLHLEGDAGADWVYYPAPSLPGFSVSLSTSNRGSGSNAVGYQELLLELRKLTNVNWAFRFGLLISPKSTARLLSIFSLARRVDAAHAFIEERNEAGMILLRQAAAGIEALELSMQRSMAFVELLRPLARQQRQLEQRYETLLLLGALRECEARRVQQLQEDVSTSLL